MISSHMLQYIYYIDEVMLNVLRWQQKKNCPLWQQQVTVHQLKRFIGVRGEAEKIVCW